jgi:hypothetical protein
MIGWPSALEERLVDGDVLDPDDAFVLHLDDPINEQERIACGSVHDATDVHRWNAAASPERTSQRDVAVTGTVATTCPMRARERSPTMSAVPLIIRQRSCRRSRRHVVQHGLSPSTS